MFALILTAILKIHVVPLRFMMQLEVAVLKHSKLLLKLELICPSTTMRDLGKEKLI